MHNSIKIIDHFTFYLTLLGIFNGANNNLVVHLSNLKWWLNFSFNIDFLYSLFLDS